MLFAACVDQMSMNFYWWHQFKRATSLVWGILLGLALSLAACGSEPVTLPVLETESTVSVEPSVANATSETWVASAKPHVQRLEAYDQPGGVSLLLPFEVPNPHQFGGPMVLMVTEGQPGDGWLKVQLPIRPNGQEGWISEQDYAITSTTIRAEVDLSETSVIVYDGNEVVAETQAVVGSSATPTPLGTFYVTAKKQNQESYLGPWALALSGFSEVHETFAGGLPVIAIHGTSKPEQIGQYRSNGCVRIPNEIVTLLAEKVPLGAPVEIRA